MRLLAAATDSAENVGGRHQRRRGSGPPNMMPEMGGFEFTAERKRQERRELLRRVRDLVAACVSYRRPPIRRRTTAEATNAGGCSGPPNTMPEMGGFALIAELRKRQEWRELLRRARDLVAACVS